jgi:hypothetical protein
VFKWVLILVAVSFLYLIGGWMMGKPKPWTVPHPQRVEHPSEKPLPMLATPTPTPSAVADTAPPSDIVILGWYSIGRGLQVRFPDGYGFLSEGDFFHDWRIKKLLTKGCILVDMSGREYLVRLRLNYPDPVPQQMQQELPRSFDPVAFK